MKCKYCLSEDVHAEPAGPGSMHHAKLVCLGCGRMLAWLPRPTVAETGPPADLRPLIVPRAAPVALCGSPKQVVFAESIRRSMLRAAARSRMPQITNMLLCIRDATWFIANKGRPPSGLRWPAAQQLHGAAGASATPESTTAT